MQELWTQQHMKVLTIKQIIISNLKSSLKKLHNEHFVKIILDQNRCTICFNARKNMGKNQIFLQI